MPSRDPTPTTNDVCVANIGPRGRRQRMGFGVAMVVVGVLAAAALIALDADRAWRLALLLPFWGGALGIFQARGYT